MPSQYLIEIITGAAGFALIFILAAMWSRLGSLEQTDKHLSVQVSEIRELIAGEYIKRTEVAPMLDRIFEELKYIRVDLGKKVERRDV